MERMGIEPTSGERPRELASCYRSAPYYMSPGWISELSPKIGMGITSYTEISRAATATQMMWNT